MIPLALDFKRQNCLDICPLECVACYHSIAAVLLAGFLQPSRVRKLEQLGVNWQPACSDANKLWDARLTQLICFRKQYGHVQVCHSPSCLF